MILSMRWILLAGILGTGPPAAARGQADSRLFSARILPIFKDTCLQCHGVLKTSRLDLRSRATMLTGGARGVDVVPGKSEQSRLYRLVAGLEKVQMPPARKLSARQVADIKAWIDQGAPWPDDGIFDERPWPYNRPVRPSVPRVKNREWVRNPVDAFVLAKLESRGLHPSPPADKRTLIRRAYFNLIGLPPSPEEIDAFLKDGSSDAYPRLIDRLLASPHYGERWARHWLDLARYAESEGFKADEMRPNAWRYRDYVIKSLNKDKGYDRFIQEQIAGDELFPNDPDALVATGFCRHWADESNARNLRLRRQEILNDITDTVGSTVLGLTFGCARCHNHKFDPIPQRDYYRMQAFFAAIRAKDDIVMIPADARPAYDARLKAWQDKTAPIREQIAAIEDPIRKKHYRDLYRKFPSEVQEAIDTPADKRTSLQWILFCKAETQLSATETEISAGIKADEKKRWTELRSQLELYKPDDPGPLPVGIGIADIGPEAPATFTLAVGVYDKPIEEVRPAVPTVCAGETVVLPVPVSTSTGRRTSLARWLTDSDNPLTARVMVNRIWQHHFGRGIVATPSDFGNTGERPSHRELLDWLACEFVSRRWSMKQMHRLIMNSNAYQQSTAFSETASKLDPENSMVWRFRRQRLEGEALRDSILSVSGELNTKMGGPSVMAELPKEVTTRGYWKDTNDPTEGARRSVYIFVKRNLRYPLFHAFDMPDTHEPCARRECTTTAPQALMMLNDESIMRSAQRFAGRVLREAGPLSEVRIERAYILAFGRPPDSEERARALEFLEKQSKLIGNSTDLDDPLLLPKPTPTGLSDGAAAAWVDFCHALMNANEFLYID